MKPYIMFEPAALGDAIISVGISKHLAQTSFVYVPVNSHLYPSVCSFYRGAENISVVECNSDWYAKLSSMACEIIESPYPWQYRVMGEKQQKIPIWDQQIYTICNVPFYKRYSLFDLESSDRSLELKNTLVGEEEYIVTHTTYSRCTSPIGIDLYSWKEDKTELKRVEISEEVTSDISDYYDILLGAKEIHCVPSSLFCLVDGLLDKISADLYVHDIRIDCMNQFNNKWNKNRWCTIHYGVKV